MEVVHIAATPYHLFVWAVILAALLLLALAGLGFTAPKRLQFLGWGLFAWLLSTLLRSCGLIVALVLASSLSASAAPAPAPIDYELACPSGFSPIVPMGRSFNSKTGKWRANLCISDKGDGTMVCQMSNCSTKTRPAGSDGEVQFNKLVDPFGTEKFAFDSDPSFMWDNTNKRLQTGGFQTINGMKWDTSSFGNTWDVPLDASTVIVIVQDGQTLDVVMPDPATAYGQIFVIKREDASTGTITIDPFGTEKFDGADDLPLVNQYQSYVLQATKEENRDNISWAILATVGGTAIGAPPPVHLPSGALGGTLYSNDGSTLSGWTVTTGGNAVTIDSDVGNPPDGLLLNTAATHMIRNLNFAAGQTLQFDFETTIATYIAMISFAADEYGNGPVLVISDVNNGGDSGITEASGYTSGGPGWGQYTAFVGSTHISITPSLNTWHTIKILFDAAGTTASWYLDNTLEQSGIAVSSAGGWVGFHGRWQHYYYVDNILQTSPGSMPSSPGVGDTVYATNGRKPGEGVGAGTGIPVYYTSGGWADFATNAPALP